MPRLILHPTSTAQWHALVSEAEHAAGRVLDEELESYLVILLMRFASKPQLLARVLALEYLDNEMGAGRARHERLRDVGDQCLLFSGLFPKQAERRMVKVSYFVDLGRSAYHQLSNTSSSMNTEVYSNLSANFVLLMDILQTMRDLQNGSHGSHMTPLNAFELWHDTGSQHAYKLISALTNGHPVKIDIERASSQAKLH